MVDVEAANESANIPAGTALKTPLHVTQFVVPTNSAVCFRWEGNTSMINDGMRAIQMKFKVGLT